ncbi:MAG: toprim domain-containing protein [Candidatus Bathyarchaeota archaeon]|nr:toprim domain-containing protein [Candidatus Bathyarchaeota archaeon]
MSARLKEKEEKIRRILDAVAEESARGTYLIVEGHNDIVALRDLGMKGPIFAVKTGGKSFDQALQEIEATGASKVILMLDFDRRGIEATKLLKQNLEPRKIVPNIRYWRALRVIMLRDVQCIEGIPSYLQTLASKTSHHHE